MDRLIIETFKPTEALSRLVDGYGKSYGTTTLDIAYALRLIESNITDADKPHIHFQLIKSFLRIISTKDPSPFHYDIVRNTLSKIAPEALQNNQAVDLLAREFVIACNRLFKALEFPSKFQSDLKSCEEEAEKLTGYPSCFQLAILDNADKSFEENFFSDGLSLWDQAYIKLYKSIGPQGRKFAKKLSKSLQNVPNLAFWFIEPKPEEAIHYFHSPAFLGLVEVIWEDICEPSMRKCKNTAPSLTKSVLIKIIKPILSKQIEIKTLSNNNSINCYEPNGKLLCNVPCVDPTLIPIICKGLQSFPSITGQRILRWQINMGFNNWRNGNENPALICTQGGYSGIAQTVGCNPRQNPEVIGQVRAILQAEAYCKFVFPDGSNGNLIAINEKEKSKNGEWSKINITLGDVLLPNYGQLLPKGDPRRLIPIPAELPPLIGPRNSHAAQGMLQLLILDEFSDQSMRFVETGSFYLPIPKWEEFARQVKLPLTRLPDVMKAWTDISSNTLSFLERQGDEYVLTKSFASVNDFFTYQGKQREIGSIGGNKSVASKRAQIQREYRTNSKKKCKVR